MGQSIHPAYGPVAFRDRATGHVVVTQSTLVGSVGERTVEVDGVTYPVVDVDVTSDSTPRAGSRPSSAATAAPTAPAARPEDLAGRRHRRRPDRDGQRDGQPVVGRARAVTVRHRIDPATQVLGRVVSDATGVLEQAEVDLEHACVGCALREDILPAHRGELSGITESSW